MWRLWRNWSRSVFPAPERDQRPGGADEPLSLWLVALAGGQVAGYVGSQTVLDEADMMNLAVAPRHRRQGIARQLVDALGDALRPRGCSA